MARISLLVIDMTITGCPDGSDAGSVRPLYAKPDDESDRYAIYMPSLSESVSNSFNASMWVGSQTDLLRLLGDIAKQYDPLLPAHAIEVMSHPSEMLKIAKDQKASFTAKFDRDMDPYIEQRLSEIDANIEEWTAKLAAAEDKASDDAAIKMTLTGKDDERRTVSGTPTELVNYLDGRYIQELEFEAPSGSILGHYISLRAGRRRGIYLHVSSTESHWGIAAFTDLKRELLVRVPWWRFVRNVFFLYAFFYISSLVGGWYIGDMIAAIATPTGKFTGTASVVANAIYIFATITITTLGVILTQRLIPAFEVTRPDKRSRGSRVLAALGSSLVAVALAIVANGISKVLMP